MEARLCECVHVCVFPRVLTLSYMCRCLRATDGRTDGRRVCEDKEKPTQESGGSLHSRLCRAPGAALFIKTANLTTRVSVCVCVRLSMCVCVCVHKSMFSSELFVFVWAHLHDCGSAWVHACALKLINTHNWRLPVIWRWGQRKLFCGTLIILVRTPGYKYCQRYALHPAFLSALHPSPKWETGVLQENKSKISMQWVVFRFFTTSLARVCSGVRFSVNA